MLEIRSCLGTITTPVKNQHLNVDTLQDAGLASGHEGLSDIRLVEDGVEHVGECWEVRKRTSTLGHLLDPTKVLALGEFRGSTDHDCQDRVYVLRTLLKPLRDVFFTEHP